MKTTNNHKRNIILLIALLIGIICFYQVLINYNWQLIGESLQRSNLALLLFGSTFSIIFYWLFRTLRWKFLLSSENIQIGFWQLYLITSVSVGLSTITPFQSGEALKVEYLKKYGFSRFSGYSIFLLERFLDLFVVVGLGIFGVAVNFNWQNLQNYLFIVAESLFVSILLMLAGIFFLPFQKLKPLKTWLIGLWQNKFQLFISFILTIFSWLAVVLGWFIALKSVLIEISFLKTISVVSLTTLLSILSFVPGAIGVSELSITNLLLKLEITNPLAQTGAIAVRVYALIIISLALIHWLILMKATSKEIVKHELD